jgi:hypothetical protein
MDFFNILGRLSWLLVGFAIPTTAAEKHTTKQCLVVCFFLLSSNVFSQYNLVPNYSFESYRICPTNTNDSIPAPWYEPTNGLGAAYANACSTDKNVSVPRNAYTGFQYAKTGNAYTGIFFMNQPNINGRNYIQVKLIDFLRSSKCYYVEFYVNHTNWNTIACNNISMAITKNQIWADTIIDPYGVIPYNAQIFNYGNPIIKDTLNWVKVSGIYTAQGGEQYITLGNFKKDNQTNYISLPPPAGFTYNGAGYYIDDVSVIPLDSMPLKADAGKDTSIANIGDSVFIGSLTNGITNITWYNSLGKIINTQAPGFYVKPSVSTFYIVEQTVCGYTSRDTVNVAVGTVPLKFISYNV